MHKCVGNGTSITIKSSLKTRFKRLDKEFKFNEYSDENKGKYRIQFFIVRCFYCGRQYKIEKGYCMSTCGTLGVYLDLKAPTFLECRNCEPHHFHLILDDEWQYYQDTSSEEGVSDEQVCND